MCLCDQLVNVLCPIVIGMCLCDQVVNVLCLVIGMCLCDQLVNVLIVSPYRDVFMWSTG